MGNEKRAELQMLVKQLVDHFHPERIICFAEIITNYSATSCFSKAKNNDYSHYFLLVITSETFRRDHEMQDYANSHFHAGSATILAHSSEAVREALENCSSLFFTTVWEKGTVLYAADGLMQLPVLWESDSRKNVEKAEKYYSKRYGLAENFLRSAEECFQLRRFNLCVFLLHQAVEQSCIAMIRVFMGYRSNFHHLGRLIALCLCFSDEPSAIFPSQNEEESRLFHILLKSYSDVRYKDDFNIDEADAQVLLYRVRKFLNMTERLCQEKMSELTQISEHANKLVVL